MSVIWLEMNGTGFIPVFIFEWDDSPYRQVHYRLGITVPQATVQILRFVVGSAVKSSTQGWI